MIMFYNNKGLQKTIKKRDRLIYPYEIVQDFRRYSGRGRLYKGWNGYHYENMYQCIIGHKEERNRCGTKKQYRRTIWCIHPLPENWIIIDKMALALEELRKELLLLNAAIKLFRQSYKVNLQGTDTI